MALKMAKSSKTVKPKTVHLKMDILMKPIISYDWHKREIWLNILNFDNN